MNVQKQILRDHKEGHAKLAETLLTKEVMYAEDLVNIFGSVNGSHALKRS